MRKQVILPRYKMYYLKWESKKIGTQTLEINDFASSRTSRYISIYSKFNRKRKYRQQWEHIFIVLRVLVFQDDFLKLAADDTFGRKLQDLELL